MGIMSLDFESEQVAQHEHKPINKVNRFVKVSHCLLHSKP